MRSFLTKPAFWLALQMLAVIGGIHLCGWDVVHEVPDSESYLQTGSMPPAQMLASIRTAGYPLFLRAVGSASPGLRILPQVHLAFHFFAVVLFYWALRYFGASPWQAFAAGTGVLWSVFHDPSIHDVASDSLAISMAIVTVSLLLFVSATPRRLGPWIGLTLCMALTYHIRPAYLFLVPLVPFLGLLFRAIHARWHRAPFLWRRYAATLLATAILPFLAFCTLRLAVVGHFGLVSFGGWNIAGIAVEMLDRPLIDAHVPEDLRATALDILQARDRVHRRHGLIDAFREGQISVDELSENYNVNVGKPLPPVFYRRYPEAKTAEGKFCRTAINRDLTRLSLQCDPCPKIGVFRLRCPELSHGPWRESGTGRDSLCQFDMGLLLRGGTFPPRRAAPGLAPWAVVYP